MILTLSNLISRSKVAAGGVGEESKVATGGVGEEALEAVGEPLKADPELEPGEPDCAFEGVVPVCFGVEDF